LAVFTNCGKSSKEQPGAATENISFRDIPGVTQNEIRAIEAIKTQYGSFVCAISPNTDAFIDRNGEVGGFTILFYEWLSGIFGIPFKPVFYEWNDLITGVTAGKIDFTIEMTDTPERRKNYFMTSPIAEHSLKFYRIKGGEPLTTIINSRRPRYAFLAGTVMPAYAAANTGYEFETIFVDSYDDAYPLLESGTIDAYISLNTTESAFDAYGNVVSENLYPLVFRLSCLLTGKAELEPVISVFEKALDARALAYLAGLRKAGYQKYLENKLYALLTEEERSYIQDNPPVPVAAEFNNYPVSFFDAHTNQWGGIYFDVLHEIANMTGIVFEYANEPSAPYPRLVTMLENGDALIISELFRIKEYEGRFLWSEVSLLDDNYAFITRSDFRNIEIGEISYLHIGIRKNTHYYELFKVMFPDHRFFTEYDTQDEVWDALKDGEIDAIFSTRRRLLIYTNYNEEAGFKLNLILDHVFNTSLGFNRDSAVLRSIIDKAIGVINIKNISSRWMNKTYDYRIKMATAQRPWLISASVSFFFVLLLVSILWIRSSGAGSRLKKLVAERTNDLALQTFMLKTMISSLPDGVFFKNLNFKYTMCSNAMAELFGKKEEEIIGRGDADGLGFPAEKVDFINKIDRKVISECRPIVYEEDILCADGLTRLFETVKAPLMRDGKAIGILGIGRDITRRKEMEEEVQAASSAKSDFLANMSHELRTPLNVVIGLTDLVLEDTNLEKRVADNLVKISSAGSTLLNIVNDILDLSKIESGKLELTPVEYYTSSLLNDVITIAVSRLGEKPITFHLDIQDDLPANLYGDDLRVKQIFTNLLSNAVKYTREGSIKLSVHCTREGPTVWMDAAVSDTGIGIREEDLKKLFSAYNQVDTKASRNIEGTGLGLAITRRLAEMMDGEIRVESEYSSGSTFRLRLKQGFVDDTPIGADIADKLRNFRYAEDKHIVTKKLIRLNLNYARVLVVDDMRTNLDVAAGFLSKYRMQVDCVDNGQRAIDRIRQGTPVYNAIFMDHMMPGMDGIEAADAIRALGTEYARKIPIIALTANAIKGTKELFYVHGFQAFISKPIDVMELDSVIRKWVRDDSRADVPVYEESSASDAQDENTVIHIPGVDTKKGLSLYAGDTKAYLSTLRSYITNTPGVLGKLRAVSAQTLPDYVITVHGLKGTSAGIGAEAVREAALKLETKSRAGDLDGVMALNDKLIRDTETVVAHIKAWLERHDAPNAKPRLRSPDREALERLRRNCESYDIDGIDEAMSELEISDYEEGAVLIAWLREKIEASEFIEAAARLTEEELVK
jgi:PAS domain S-box-containing protein